MHPHRVRPASKVRLARIAPDDVGRWRDEQAARDKRKRDLDRLADLQEVLYAERRHAVLIILQGMDTSGKDGTIKHLIRGVDPNGCAVMPFKVPTEDEAAHDFLWRIHRATPRRGYLTIFNRSHYEDVIWPRVHRTVPPATLARRYDHINAFERLLVESDTLVLKFFLHISKAEQRRRLRERLDDPTKHWKFNPGDVHERKLWSRYMAAYEVLLGNCSTDAAPWYVIPADHKWYRNLAIAEIVVDRLAALKSRFPRLALSKAEVRRLAL